MKTHNLEPEKVVFWHTPCFLIYDSPEFKEYPMHWHDSIEILMPTENVFPVVCGSREYLLKENDVLIIPSGELHNLKAQKGKRIIMLCDNAMFKDNPALSEINMMLSKPLWLESTCGIAELVSSTINDMVKIYDEQPLLCETILYQKLIYIFMKIAAFEKGDRQKNKSFRNMELIKKYIDKYYMKQITLGKLAEAVGYSKYHLSRVMNGSGVSLVDMLNERRIKEAETLLHNENRAVTQIAMDVGFSSITAFNRAFRKIKGCTPTQFRSMYKDKNTH